MVPRLGKMTERCARGDQPGAQTNKDITSDLKSPQPRQRSFALTQLQVGRRLLRKTTSALSPPNHFASYSARICYTPIASFSAS